MKVRAADFSSRRSENSLSLSSYITDRIDSSSTGKRYDDRNLIDLLELA
ncbi:MAG TPA: hypothetical protein V6D28_19785 [Leptolyngbyaceae cyanobacterium]